MGDIEKGMRGRVYAQEPGDGRRERIKVGRSRREGKVHTPLSLKALPHE